MCTKWGMGLEGEGRGAKYNQNIIYEILKMINKEDFLELSEAERCACDGNAQGQPPVFNAADDTRPLMRTNCSIFGMSTCID